MNSQGRLTTAFFFRVLYNFIVMQILASLRRRTKSGISVWHFCRVAETDQYMAVGGDSMKVISCTDRKHLRRVYENFKANYGYAEKLPAEKQYISDPWDSQLPANLQMQFEALSF